MTKANGIFAPKMPRDILSLVTSSLTCIFIPRAGQLKTMYKMFKLTLVMLDSSSRSAKCVADLEGRIELGIIVSDHLDVMPEGNLFVEIVALLNRDLDVGDS